MYACDLSYVPAFPGTALFNFFLYPFKERAEYSLFETVEVGYLTQQSAGISHYTCGLLYWQFVQLSLCLELNDNQLFGLLELYIKICKNQINK